MAVGTETYNKDVLGNFSSKCLQHDFFILTSSRPTAVDHRKLYLKVMNFLKEVHT